MQPPAQRRSREFERRLARLIAIRVFRNIFGLDRGKRGYYSIKALNPFRVVPLSPELAWAAGRAAI